MTQLLSARVTEADAAAADRIAEKLTKKPTAFTDLLFNVPATGPAAYMAPRDHAAVGMVLTCSPRLWDVDEQRLLRVISAVGRVHRRGGTGPCMDIGVIMLAGEIATRYFHQRLVGKHGPYGFEPLTVAISTLWPLPGETLPHIQGDPGMAVLRMTGGMYRDLLTTTDRQALQLLGRGMPSGAGQGVQLRCIARICQAVTSHRSRFSVEGLAAVGEAVLTARTTGQPHPMLATTVS